MSARTGLGPLETALLDTVDLLVGESPEHVRCSDVLSVLERRHGIGPRYSWPVLVDLSVPWRVHLPLLDTVGNVGTQGDDPPADPQYVETRLSPVGALALASERGEIGPVPLALVEGSLYRGGAVPPFDPARVVGALLAAEDDCGPPVLPTGGTVEGDVDALLAGETVRLTLACTIRAAGGDLLITEVPLGVSTDDVLQHVANRANDWERHGPRAATRIRRAGSPVVDIRDESSQRHGLQLRIALDPGSDLRKAVEWLRDVWPVTIEVDCRLPAPQAERLRTWDRGDGSGLRALSDLLRPLP